MLFKDYFLGEEYKVYERLYGLLLCEMVLEDVGFLFRDEYGEVIDEMMFEYVLFREMEYGDYE